MARAPSGPFDTVEGGHLLARSRGADAQAVARQLVEVVGMGGLAELEHDVVGSVDDVVDGPHPGQGEPARHPRRRGPDLDTGEDAGGEAGTEIVVHHLDGDRRGIDLDRAKLGWVGYGEGQPQAGGEVTGHPGHAPRVGPVGLDGDVVDDVGDDPERLDEALPRRRCPGLPRPRSA